MSEVAYFATARGARPVANYLMRLARDGRAADAANILHVIDLLAEQGGLLGAPYSRMLDSRYSLYELRAGAHRIAYVRRGNGYLLLHAWSKSTQKADEREVGRARRRLA